MKRLVLRNARIATFAESGDFDNADILIGGDTIIAVGPEVDSGEAEQFDASGKLAIPGMIDTHSHLSSCLLRGVNPEAWGSEFFTNIAPTGAWKSPEDMYTGVYTGAVELLAAGVTSVLEYCGGLHSAEHADAAVRALRDAGIRARFGYNLLERRPAQELFADAERVNAALSDDPMIDLGIALSTINVETMAGTAAEVEFARALGTQMTFHNNKGGELILLDRAGLLDRDILPAHSNYVTDDDLAALAACHGYLSTQPEAEVYSGRRDYSMVARAHRLGIGIALGNDVTSMSSPGIIPQMRLLHLLQRYLDGEYERHEGHVPIARRPGWPTLTFRDILRFGTLGGAEALSWADRVGKIAPGYQADITLFNARMFGMAEGDPAVHAVAYASHADVDSVLVAGQFRKRDGRLVGVDLAEIGATRAAASRRLHDAAHAGGHVVRQVWWDWVASDERF